ncbi:MAG: diacylglycerol kinase [Proteobacteria bacterium]|nr:diacylglycerol kinase [Pseudomonadota bacterium]
MFITKLISAFFNSLNGLKLTWAMEMAFRIEVFVCLLILPFLYWVEGTRINKMLVIFSLLLVLIVELINTAIEKANDALKKTNDPLIKFSKDAASASVFLSACFVGLCLLNLLFN